MPNNILTLAGTALVFLTTVTNAVPSELVARQSSLIPGYDFNGCYADGPGTRQLTSNSGFTTLLTLQKCAIFCQDYTFFGAAFGNCYCGNTINFPTNTGTSASCDALCAGDVTQRCGGLASSGAILGRISIYRKNGQPLPLPPAVSSYKSVGCFIDVTGALGATRALQGGSFLGIPTLRTLECEAICTGFTFYATENANECFCGNTLTLGSRASRLSDCNKPCSGDSTQNCGSGNRMNLYSTIPSCVDIHNPLRVKNPGFENGPFAWTLLGGGSPSSDIKWQALAQPGLPRTGTRVARVVGTVNNAFLTLAQTVPVCPGVPYIVNLWTRQEVDSGCKIVVRINGNLEINSDGDSTYVEKKASFIPTQASVELQLRVQCNGNARFKTMYIDDVQIRAADLLDVVNEIP